MVTAPLAVWSALNMTSQHAVPHPVAMKHAQYARSHSSVDSFPIQHSRIPIYAYRKPVLLQHPYSRLTAVRHRSRTLS